MEKEHGKGLLKVGRTSVKGATGFAYDGCHKIYLLRNGDGEADAREHGYEVLPLDELEKTFCESCCLRFVNWWSDLKTVVRQGATQVRFTYANGVSVVKFSRK